MPATGESWNQFKLLEPLGKGGMGEVFLAEDGSLERKVALKFLPEQLQKSGTARERFLREARSAAALDHPYICKIYEIGEVEGKAFIAMEYIQGVTLQDKITDGPLPLPDLVQVGIEIGEAVEAAHKKQIIHRDLKTPNIMVTTDDHVKVMDFGLAKQVRREEGQDSNVETLSARLTEEGSTPGTVIYMSPEQVRGEPLDTRSDIFSFGVVLYELATGKVPFQGATSGLTYDAILNRGAASPRQLNPDVPVELEQVIQKALEKDREHRYQTVKELLVDMKRLRRDSDTGTLSFAELGLTKPAESKSHGPVVVAAVVGALVIAGLLLFRPSAPDVVGTPIDSLAVLPFENTRDDPNVNYLADGIAESLINQLSQLPQLSVQARSAAFRYRGDNVDPQSVGRELGVGAVLTGRVVQQGNRLNVQAELVDAESGRQLWGQQYEHAIADLLTVQNNLATEISQALRLELTGGPAAIATADSDAYRAYLQGRFYWRQRTNEDFKKAIGFFEEAREIDPNYALAYAGLADSYSLLGGQFYGVDEDYPPADAIAQARASALEALRLNEDLAEPRATLGFIKLMYDRDWSVAETYFLEAIERNPTYVPARQWYGMYLSLMDRHEEAISQGLRAVELEPSSPLSRRFLATNYVQAGRYDEATEELEAALVLAPSFPNVREWLMQLQWMRGETELAVSLAEAFGPRLGRFYRLASEGRREAARDVLASGVEALDSSRSVALYLLLDDTDTFFEALQESVENRDRPVTTVFLSPLINVVRTDPRMLAIRQQLGLPH